MRTLFVLFLVPLLFSCHSRSRISQELDCNPESYKNLEAIEDFKRLFTVQFPDNWKTNLYYDNNQSSIYTADTTKQLTDTYLIDITHVSNELKLNKDFYQKFTSNLSSEQLVETTSYELKFQEKESYYSRASGKKGKFNYEVSHLFIKINTNNYIHAKAEVYGDSLVNQRFCNAFSLIEKIAYKP